MIQRFWQKTTHFGYYTPILAMYLIALPILTISRLGLMIWQSEAISATGMWGQIFLQGIRVDIIQLGLMAIIPLLMMPFFSHKKSWAAWRYFSYIWIFISLLILVFFEVISVGFIAEYGVRPNRLFIEYLKYPEDMLPMLWDGFRIHVFAVLLLIGLAIFAFIKLLKPWHVQAKPSNTVKHWLLWPMIVLLVVFSVRSTTVHRPANPAYFAITSDSTVNNIVLNGTWSLLHAVYSFRHERDAGRVYGEMSLDDAMQQIILTRGMLQDDRPLLENKDIPTLTHQTASIKRDKPLNLVIVLQESLGAGFVESLGGTAVTPELEKLKAEGWWFNNLYATGTRSVRGIEAVTTGFLPTPAQSVVKLSGAQSNFFTLASALKDKGYLSEFIYGGEAHFDNMRSFFINNDFNSVVDEKDYVNPVFVGSWGASDEDLFNKTHAQLMAHHNEQQPFFSLVFTSSNHSPFEFPDGRIDLFEQPKNTEFNAVKYADYAMGEFFRKAKQSPYWQNTLFLIVADHDIRVRGNTLVPIKNFHIPGLILGADIKPKVLNTLASQIDLPTTMLSLMGVDAIHPMLGRDLSREPADLKGRAMMQYNDNYAWLEGEEAVILRPNHEPTFVIYNRRDKTLHEHPATVDAAEMEKRALGHALLPSILYAKKMYHLPVK